MYIADLHCDTIREIWLSHLRGAPLSLRDTSRTGHPLQIDLEKMQAGSYLLQSFALYINLHMPSRILSSGTDDSVGPSPASFLPEGISETGYVDPWFQFTEMLRVFQAEMAANQDLIRQIHNRKDLESNLSSGRMSALLTVEEGGILQGDLHRLQTLYDAGVRIMTLTWNYENELGSPNQLPAGVKTDFKNFFRFRPIEENGLTSFGKEAAERMEELGILPDVSHLSDAGFYDIADVIKGPFVASHSNARSLCGCSRNLTDDMIRIIGEHGGVIGLNYCPSFVSPAEREENCFSSCEALIRHARHIMSIGGKEVLALGSDFDGIPRIGLEIEDASQMQKLADQMYTAGFSPDEIEGICCKNVLRLLRETLPSQ